ncbi:CrcB family protein [Isoptericola variabilis]|uniref:Fluoride-specific ion channel FluC n=1 Tax=Isoptericola variabilis (strain 225) TaxID=743718 RepID=F6FW41_ISOV2|nr:CrcB family protein [Isoptericola variabilis]AEG45585.1 CrcB-like protein [Isoptericola variabilis 225]TWH25807.1 CrcB protein [Isoptericola variabilis J7]
MSAPARPPHRDVRLLGLVAMGGAVGSGLRYAVALALPWDAGSWPWATFAVNVVGAFLLGWLLEAVAMRGPETFALRRWRLFAGTGLLGGFTTYSSLALELERLLASGAWGVALGYAAGSLVLGTAAALAGLAAGRRTPPSTLGVLLRGGGR